MTDFSVIYDPKCSETTNKMRERHLRLISGVVYGKPDKFYMDRFTDFDRVISKLEYMFNNPEKYGISTSHKKISIDTRISYMASLCKMLRILPTFPTALYEKYNKYYENIVSQKEQIKLIKNL